MTRTRKTSLGLAIGAAITLAIGVSSAAQAQYYGSQNSFNRGFAGRPGAIEALKRGQAAQNYRFQQRQGQYNRSTRNLFSGRSPQARMLRERGNIARQTRTDARYRAMMNRHGVASSSQAVRARRAGQMRELQRRGNMARQARNARNARNAANAARAARYARTARYATGAGAVAALAGVDPISMGIHAATNPKDFGRKAAYYARNPHKGVEQMGKNVVRNTTAIGRGVGKGACGVGNLFKKRNNRSRC